VGEPPSLIVSGSILSLIVSIGAIVILMLLSGIIAASEVALFSLSPSEIDRFKKSSDRREISIAKLMSVPLMVRVTLLSLHVFTKIAITTSVLMLLWRPGISAQPLIYALIASFLAVLFLTEVVPRLLAKRNNIRLAKVIAPTLQVLVALTKPLVLPLLAIRSRWKNVATEKKSTHEELSEVLELTVNAETDASNGKEILRGVVNFGLLNVKDLMKPREAISAIPIRSSFTELINHINQSGYSRIPVYNDNLDFIEGVLYTKDLLPFLGDSTSFEWSGMLRPGFYVSENKKIDLLLKDFQEKRVHMAIVRDENGRTSGLITLEDLIEQIIGELNVEVTEIPDNGFLKLDDNTFVFDGRTPIEDFFTVLDQDYPFLREPGDHESLEDFIIEFNDELPEAGDELYYEQFTFVVETVEQKRIKRVRVHVHAQA